MIFQEPSNCHELTFNNTFMDVGVLVYILLLYSGVKIRPCQNGQGTNVMHVRNSTILSFRFSNEWGLERSFRLWRDSGEDPSFPRLPVQN